MSNFASPVDFCGEWHAYRNEMPGAGKTLRVSGSCCFPTDGWKAELVPHEGNTGINPNDLWLDVKVTPPNELAIEVLTEVPVEYVVRDLILPYTHVTVSKEGDPTQMKNLPVEIVH